MKFFCIKYSSSTITYKIKRLNKEAKFKDGGKEKGY